MKTEILNIDTGKAKELSVLDSIFSVSPRKDVLNRVVRWQMARKQQGTHSVKTRSEGSYSKAKIYRQKGTGGARHGDRNAPIFRKGGVYKGPTPRSHEHKLNKKFREFTLKEHPDKCKNKKAAEKKFKKILTAYETIKENTESTSKA